ncbi:putative nucleic acid-binding protein [Mucilaginibacter rubeus]|jgi:hypothetical protein|nr:hypothetical protein SAMN03159284_00012 [Mucilaginibacter sp. NFR10]
MGIGLTGVKLMIMSNIAIDTNILLYALDDFYTPKAKNNKPI